MVRRIRHCSTPSCRNRFVCRQNSQIHCEHCTPAASAKLVADVTNDNPHSVCHSPASKRFKTCPSIDTDDSCDDDSVYLCHLKKDDTSTPNPNVPTPSTVHVETPSTILVSNSNPSMQKFLEDIQNQSSDDESTNSEGIEEIQCTQLVVQEDDDEPDDETETDDNIENFAQSTTVSAATEEATETDDNLNFDQSTTAHAATDNVCFICGSSLERITTGLKGRISHIKRCAKLYGVNGRDVSLQFDHEDITVEPNAKAVITPNNPYGKQQAWHGKEETEKDLRLAAAATTTTATNHSKQTSLTSFFKAPMRSLNNVLLSNARMWAKSGGIKAATASKEVQKGGRRAWGRRQQQGVTRSCPSYKRIPGTNFVVDGFHYARPTLTKNYFLTHFHSDHYGGLTRNWSCGTIYCSLITANLLHERLGIERQYLHPLGLNTPGVIESDGRPIQVTLFDANHCPGAVLFLFQIGKKTILHVGDFRWHKEQMKPVIQAISRQPQLDELFLDTTYCDAKYDLPSQDVAIKAAMECAVREVQQSRSKKERLLLLFGAYTIGKERIFFSVAERLGFKIYVDSSRYKVLSLLDWPKERQALLTTKKEEADLWVVPLNHINFKKLPPYLSGLSKAKNPVKKYDRVIGFRPTGWSNTPGNSVISTRTSGSVTVHSVPYSEHSSFPELLDCVATLKPKKITPTVSVSKSSQQVELLLRSLKSRQQLIG